MFVNKLSVVVKCIDYFEYDFIWIGNVYLLNDVMDSFMLNMIIRVRKKDL